MKKDKHLLASSEKMDELLARATEKHFGVLDSKFLQKCTNVLNPKSPVCVKQSESVDSVMRLLRKNAIGCVLITAESSKLLGIFGERDFMLKVYGSQLDLSQTPVSEFMTPDPVVITPDTRIAYALTLMSHLGFRHLPVVSDDNRPISIVSIKDIVDYLVTALVEDLLDFKAQEAQ